MIPLKRFTGLTIFLILAIAIASSAQQLVLKKTKEPIFKSGEWVSDISEIKIYDDDLIFGRIRFNENKAALDTIQRKINNDERGQLRDRLYPVLDNKNTIAEVGDGLIHFYSTKFKKKYTRDFFYFVSSANGETYLTMIIDIEDSGSFYPMMYSATKIEKGKGRYEVQLSDIEKQLSDFRLVRVW